MEITGPESIKYPETAGEWLKIELRKAFNTNNKEDARKLLRVLQKNITDIQDGIDEGELDAIMSEKGIISVETGTRGHRITVLPKEGRIFMKEDSKSSFLPREKFARFFGIPYDEGIRKKLLQEGGVIEVRF